MLRPLTDHIEVLTDYIGILKYPNRQKVICTLYSKIKSKFLFFVNEKNRADPKKSRLFCFTNTIYANE